jgi:hypothetical protein
MTAKIVSWRQQLAETLSEFQCESYKKIPLHSTQDGRIHMPVSANLKLASTIVVKWHSGGSGSSRTQCISP